MADQRFKVNNDFYDIPENEINDFLKDMPNAVKMKSFTYKSGNDLYNIPENEVLAFKKDMPNAYPVLGNIAPKELTPEQQNIKAKSEEFVVNKSEQAKQRYEAQLIQAERKALAPLHSSLILPLAVEALASTAKYSGGALSFATGGKLGKGMYEAGTQLSKAIKPEYLDSGSAGEELKNIYKLDEKGAKARKQFIIRGAYGVADQAPLLIANTGAAIAGVGRLGMLANTFFTSATSASGNKFIQLDDSKLSMLDKYINSSLTGAIEGATEIITNPVQNAMVNSFLKRGKRDLAIQLVKKKLKDAVGKSILRGGAQVALGEPSEDVLSGIGESIVDNWTGLNKERYAKNKNVFEGVFDTYANSLASSLLMSSPAVAVNTYHTNKEVNFRNKYGLNDEQVTKLVNNGYQIDGFDKEQGDVIFSKATNKGVEKVAYNKETGELNKTRTAIETDQSENLVANTYNNNDKLIDTVQIVTGQPEQITTQDIAEQVVTEGLTPEEVQTEEVVQEQPITEEVIAPIEQVTETIPVTENVERETIEPVGNPDKLKIDKENIVKGIDNVLESKNLKGTDVAINLKDLQKELKLTKPQFKEMLDSIFAGGQISGDFSLGFSRDMKNKVYGDYATISKVIPQEVTNAKEIREEVGKGSEQKRVEGGTQERLRLRNDEQNKETGKEKVVSQEVKDEKSQSSSKTETKKEGLQVEQAIISQNGKIYSSKSKKTPKSKKLSTINDVTQAISKVLGSNVNETNIEGDRAVLKLNNGGTLEINMFDDIMKVTNTNGAVGAYRSRIIEGKLSSLIKISRNYNEGNTTAYHEAFHMAFDLFLQSREKTYLQTKFDNIEDMADSFADYCYKKDERGYIGKLFDKLLRAIVNFTKELFGADSAHEVEAIFRGLYEGQYKLNPKFETEMIMWGWYQKGTNYKSVSDKNKADSLTPEATKKAESKKTTAIKEVFDSLTDGKYELFKNEKGEIKNSMLIPTTQLWIDKFKPAIVEGLSQPLPAEAKAKKAEKEYRKKAMIEFMEVALTPNMKKSITYSNFKKAINKAKMSKTYLNNFNKLLDNIEKSNNKVLYNLFKKKLSIKKYKDLDIIKQIKYYSKLSQDQVLEIDRELSLQDIDNLDTDTQFMVETYGNLKDKSASGMLNAYAQLNYSQKENATSYNDNKKKMTEFYKSINDEIIKNLKLTSTEQKIFERNSKSSIDLYLKESKKKIPLIDNGTIQQYLNNSYTFQTKMNLLDNSAYNGYFYNTFFRPLHEALANKENGMLRWAEHVDDIFIRAFGEMTDTKRKNLKSEMIRNVNDDYNVNTYDKDGVAHKLNISPAILIQMYLQWNDEAQRTGLIRNEFTEQTYNEVLEEMKKNKGYLEFANGIKDEFFTTYGNELNEVYTRVNGFSLDLVQNYFPIHREIADELDPVSKGQPFVFTDIRKVSNVHLLNRIDNNNPVRFGGDIFTTIDNHISTMEHYKAFAVVGEVIRKTIGASKTLDAVSLRKGKIFADGLKADLVDINAGSTVNDKGSALKGLMYKFYKAVLTFNIPVMTYQISSAGLIGSVGEGSFLSYLYNFSKFALDVKSWKEAQQMIKKSPMLMRRYSHLLYNYDAYYSQSVSHKKVNKASQTWDNLTDNVNVNKMGDKVAVMWGGYTLYKLQFDKYVKQGMTELEADKKAITDVEIAVNTTQQSGEILYTPRILRDKGITRMFTMFQSQQAALFNMQISNLNAFIYDIKDYKTNNKDGFKRFTKDISRKYSSYLLLATGCNLLYTLMRSGMTIPDDDKEKIKWLSETVIKGIVGNFIVVGDLLNTIATSLIFRESPTTYSLMKSVSSPVIQQTVMSTEAFLKYAKSEEKLSPNELWEATRKIQPLVLGYPVDIGSRMVEGTIAFKDDPTYHNLLRTLGWSDKALKY